MTSPAFVELGEVSPTAATALSQCFLKVAYSRDPRFRPLLRLTERTALGVAAHRLTERCWRGEYDAGCGVPVDVWLRAAWQTVVADLHESLRTAWRPAEPPPPREWPGYALTRARLLARLVPVALQHARTPRPARTAGRAVSEGTPPLPWVERRLKDESRRLVGAPDLVEDRNGSVVLVDLKSGTAQNTVSEAQRRQLLLYAHLVRESGLPLPRRAVVLDAAGREEEVAVTPADVAASVEEVMRLRAAYNASLRTATAEGLAAPGPDACRGCPYRAACGPFLSAWTEEWNVGRGVWGTLRGQTKHRSGYEAEVLAKGPIEVRGQTVRLLGLVAPLAADLGEDVAAVRTDVLGGPSAQRTRWSTLLWPLLDADLQRVPKQEQRA